MGCIKDESGTVHLDDVSVMVMQTNYIKILYVDDGRIENPRISKLVVGRINTAVGIKRVLDKIEREKATGNVNIAFEIEK